MANPELFNDNMFLFLLGPEKTPVSVYKDVVADLSEPLKKMMTNGMRESLSGKADLVEVDIEVFRLFLQFAYGVTYIANSGAPEKTDETAELSRLLSILKWVPANENREFCGRCGESCCGDICIGVSCVVSNQPDSYCKGCGRQMNVTKKNKMCMSCSRDPHKNGKRLRFTEFEYPASGLSHASFRHLLDGLSPLDLPTASLVTHAMLYVFGEMYLIRPLQKQCLHKLHRDLSDIDLDMEGNRRAAIDLIAYTYANTASTDGVGEGSGAELRYLVSAYAFCMERHLIGFDEYRSYLAAAESSEFQRDVSFHRYDLISGKPGHKAEPEQPKE